MDRRGSGIPIYIRHRSSTDGPSSPSMSPLHHRLSSGSNASAMSNIKRTQNLAARAANARLAQVMASQSAGNDDGDGDDDDDEDEEIRFGNRLLGSRGSGNGGPHSLLGRTPRSPSPAFGRNFVDPPAARSTSAGRSSISSRPSPLVPPSLPSLRTASPIPVRESATDKWREKRFPADIGHTGNQRGSSALRDELDMLQEENENILEKLRLAEEKREETEARARELENQIASLGEGVSLEARLINRKEAALRQREAALKTASQTKDGSDEEITALRKQVETAKEDVATAVDQLREAESDAKALHSMTQRMILTEEEMEEIVLKRCWLARYWGLAVCYGVYPDIAASKHEHWSSLAPLPLEVVISAGQKAIKEFVNKGDADLEKRNELVRGLSDITGEGNIEGMLSVEKDLRELAYLKVEDAIMLAMASHRRPSFLQQAMSDNRSPGDSKFMEAFELNKEESEDVLFKQSWLAYFWRRAKNHGVEDDIAEERLHFWGSHIGQSPTSHDAIDVERGLLELRKLGIEQQLWEASRRELS